MDPRAQKLARKGIAPEEAEALVKAGFDRPSKIRRAKVKELEAIPGMSRSKRERIRKIVGAK